MTAAHAEQQIIANVQCVDIVSTGDRIDMLVGKAAGDDGRTGFFHQRSLDGGKTWSNATRVDRAEGPAIAKHGRGHDAKLAVRGEAITAIWTLQADGPMNSGPLATAWSDDGGKSWRQGASPSGDAAKTGARFPAIVATDAAVHAVWIHAVGRERALYASVSEDHGKTWSTPTVVDPVICACCWNTLCVGPAGEVYALYRNHDRSDMHLAVRDARGQWQLRGAVGAFDWLFEGCPHTGGGLAVVPGDQAAPPELVATVWTGEPASLGAYVTTSTDSGGTWSKPVPLIDDGIWKGQHTDVAASGGQVIVALDNIEGTTSRVLARLLLPTGAVGPTVPLSDAKRNATHPRAIATSAGWLIAWTQSSEDGETLELVLTPMGRGTMTAARSVGISSTLTPANSVNTLSVCECCPCDASGS